MTLALLPCTAPGQDAAVHEVSVSPESPTPRGTWRYRQLRLDTPAICRANEPKDCITNVLLVENHSADTLECAARIIYDGVNNENLSSMTSVRVVLPKETRDVMRDHAKPDVAVTAAVVECKARAAQPLLNVPKECRFQVVDAAQLEAFYPEASRRIAEDGPVDLEFTLEQPQGHATAISVFGSSLSERLDAAAVKYLESVTFSSPCPGTRYQLRVRFKLQE